jgi:type IV pilus assembly protein PilV
MIQTSSDFKLTRKPGAGQAGVTMVEVLVAVLVLAVGLLGVAGLQSLSLKNTTTAHFAQEAQSYSDDLINRIMANNQRLTVLQVFAVLRKWRPGIYGAGIQR